MHSASTGSLLESCQFYFLSVLIPKTLEQEAAVDAQLPACAAAKGQSYQSRSSRTHQILPLTKRQRRLPRKNPPLIAPLSLDPDN